MDLRNGSGRDMEMEKRDGSEEEKKKKKKRRGFEWCRHWRSVLPRSFCSMKCRREGGISSNTSVVQTRPRIHKPKLWSLVSALLSLSLLIIFNFFLYLVIKLINTN